MTIKPVARQEGPESSFRQRGPDVVQQRLGDFLCGTAPVKNSGSVSPIRKATAACYLFCATSAVQAVRPCPPRTAHVAGQAEGTTDYLFLDVPQWYAVRFKLFTIRQAAEPHPALGTWNFYPQSESLEIRGLKAMNGSLWSPAEFRTILATLQLHCLNQTRPRRLSLERCVQKLLTDRKGPPSDARSFVRRFALFLLTPGLLGSKSLSPPSRVT